MLISDRADFKARKLNRDKEDHYIWQSGQLSKKTTTFDMYVPNNAASNYTKKKLIELQGETDEPTLEVKDFNNPLWGMDRSSGQKIS